MAPLSDDVMLIVLSHTDIDTFLTCRLLNRKVHKLMDTHIHGLTDAVARATFPKQTRVLGMAGGLEAGSVTACLRYLNGLKFEQLAAIMLECCRGTDHSVSAEDPLGDRLRSTVSKGWAVLAKFARIYGDVSNLPLQELRARYPSTPSFVDDGHATTIDICRLRELETCARRLQYVESLSLDELRGYKYLHSNLLQAAFGFREPSPHVRDNGDVAQYGKSKASVWVFNYFAKVGPESFWGSWWNSRSALPDPNDTLTSKIEAAWYMRDGTVRKLERHGIETIDYQISRILRKIQTTLFGYRMRPTTPEGIALWKQDCLQELGERRTALTEEGESPPPKVLTAVPFEQELDWKAFGHPPRPVITPALQRNERICPTDRGRREPNVLPEFRMVYEEWEQGWKERKSWESYKSLLGGL